MLTLPEQKRLAHIRVSMEKHRALGFDVSTWEAEFFIGIIARLTRQLASQKGEPMNSITTCPICHSQGCIFVMDYLDQAVQEHRQLLCPLCRGLGFMKTASPRTPPC